MIIEGDDGIDSDHTTFNVSCYLQMVVLIFFKWIDCEDEWEGWARKN
jgi:hypothetical protein